jgi:hypothetical protein
MAADALIDTGAILAILNKADPWHVLRRNGPAVATATSDLGSCTD